MLLLQGCWCHQLVTVTFLPAAVVASPGASSDALAGSLFLLWVLAPCKWDIAPVPVASLYIVTRLFVTWELTFLNSVSCHLGTDTF